MTNYINKEAMLEEIARREPLMVDNKMISIDALRAFIMNRPIADVEEVKHGHWIFHHALNRIVDDDYFECSLCGYKTYDWDEPPYCQDCGAKMDEGDENNGTYQ